MVYEWIRKTIETKKSIKNETNSMNQSKIAACKQKITSST